MTQFDKLPKVSTIDALNFWLEKQNEYKSSVDFLLFGEHVQRQKYLDIIPFVQAAIDALEIKQNISNIMTEMQNEAVTGLRNQERWDMQKRLGAIREKWKLRE